MARPFKPCSVEGCNRSAAEPGSGRGYCAKHYLRVRRHGDPLYSAKELPPRLCSVDGCERRHFGHGLCSMHHQRLTKRGTLADPNRAPMGVKGQWVQDHVNYAGDDCLKWPFSVGDHGRGHVTIDGRNMSAPRAMCALAHGEPPTPQHEAAHSCGKGHEGCMNPKHLSWKTTSENRMDMADHGTLPRGEVVNTAKLTEDQVREIRRMGKSMSSPEIGKLFGVSRYTVWEIQTRRSWAWLN